MVQLFERYLDWLPIQTTHDILGTFEKGPNIPDSISAIPRASMGGSYRGQRREGKGAGQVVVQHITRKTNETAGDKKGTPHTQVLHSFV